MKNLWFTNEWSKLGHPLFTTIRQDKGTNYYQTDLLYNVRKGNYRHANESKLLGVARLVAKRSMKLDNIDETLAEYDADMSLENLKAMLTGWYGPNPPLLLLVFLWDGENGKEALF